MNYRPKSILYSIFLKHIPLSIFKITGQASFYPCIIFFASAIGSISLLFLDNNLTPSPSAHQPSNSQRAASTPKTFARECEETNWSAERNGRRTVTRDSILLNLNKHYNNLK